MVKEEVCEFCKEAITKKNSSGRPLYHSCEQAREYMAYTNRIKAIALGLGRELERMAWYELTGEQVYNSCKEKAIAKGLTEQEAILATTLAMNYITGK
jgi:hypothetical protein